MQAIPNERRATESTDEYPYIKKQCRYGQLCYAFNRLNQNGYRSDDIVHCHRYFHPGRRAGTSVPENFGSNKFITAYQNWGIAIPKGAGLWNGQVRSGELIQELESNGFRHVLDVTAGPYGSLNDVAREKLNHPRHRSMGSPLSHDQMLAIVLYTNTNVYTDLRRHEMEYSMQNFAETYPKDLLKKKWPILGRLLNSAIFFLDRHDKTSRHGTVYHGLNNIEVDPSTFNNKKNTRDMSEYSRPVFRYGTFISTSYDKQVATAFLGENGALLEIDLHTNTDIEPLVGADVSWISKFPIEGEFLIARGATFIIDSMVSSQKYNCQIVKVKQGPISHNRIKWLHIYS
jgi:hypothetical protein